MEKYQTHRDHGLYSAKDVAKIVHVSSAWVLRHHRPTTPHGHRLWYTEADVEKIKAFADKQENYQISLRQQRESAGYYSVRGAAEAAGVPLITWTVGIKTGRIPPPTHRYGLYLCYTRQEAVAIAESMRRRHAPPGALSRKQVQEMLGVTARQISDVVNGDRNIGVKTGPRHRWYFADDVERIRKVLLEKDRQRQLMTTRQCAIALGIKIGIWDYHVRRKGLQVGVKVGKLIRYTQADLEVMRAALPPKYRKRPVTML